MRTEVPVCRRCCFCMPLRYGLIVWGYFKLVLDSMLLSSVSFELFRMIRAYGSEETRYRVYTPYVVFACIVLVVMIVDIALSITFIIGCHKKHVKIMKTYYFYSMYFFGLTSAFCLYAIGMSVYYLSTFGAYTPAINVFIYEIVDIMMFVANMVIQFYIILLVRSEIIKLRDGCQFRFVNNAAQAQCTLEVEDSKREKDIEKNKTGVDSDDDVRIYV